MALITQDLAQRATALKHEGSNPVGEASAPMAPDPPPLRLPLPPVSGVWELLHCVLRGFGEDHEIRYWQFVQRRNLFFTTILVRFFFWAFLVQLWGQIRKGTAFPSSYFILPSAILSVINLLICHWRRHAELGVGMMAWGIIRSVGYAGTIFGAPPFYSSPLFQTIKIPTEALFFANFERVPIMVYAPVFHAMWFILFIRESYERTLHPLLILAGCFTSLAFRIRADMQDRQAYMREVAARRDS